MNPAVMPDSIRPAVQLLTAEDLWNLPLDGVRRQLSKGELLTMPPAGFEHGVIGLPLAARLHARVEADNLGVVVLAETGFILARDPDTVRAADIAFVSRERIERVGIPKKFFPEWPDLAVEILSPSDTVDAVDEKVQEWLAAGTRLVWIVKPRQKTVTVYRPGAQPIVLTADDILDGQDVIPGFQVRVGDLFR